MNDNFDAFEEAYRAWAEELHDAHEAEAEAAEWDEWYNRPLTDAEVEMTRSAFLACGDVEER